MAKLSKEEITQILNEAGVNDEAGRRNTTKAALISEIVCISISLILILLKLFVQKTFDFGLITLLFAADGTIHAYEGKLESNKKKKLIGIIELVVAALFFIISVAEVFA